MKSALLLLPILSGVMWGAAGVFVRTLSDYGMDSATATKLLSGDDPMQSFWESLEEWYFDYECQLRDELEQDVQSSLTAGNGPYLPSVSGVSRRDHHAGKDARPV